MKRAVRLTRKWAKRGYYIIFAGMIVTSAAALAQIIWMGMAKFALLEGARPGWMTPLMMAGIVMLLVGVMIRMKYSRCPHCGARHIVMPSPWGAEKGCVCPQCGAEINYED